MSQCRTRKSKLEVLQDQSRTSKIKTGGATRSQSRTSKIKTVGATSRTSVSFSKLLLFIYFVRFLNKQSFLKIVSLGKKND